MDWPIGSVAAGLESMSQLATHPNVHFVRYWFGRTVSTALDVLLPPVCPLCADYVVSTSSLTCPHDLSRHDDFLSAGTLFCDACLTALRYWPAKLAYCPRCAFPQPPELVADHCGHCQGVDLAFDRVVPLSTYHGAMTEAVVAAKSPRNAALASQLGRLLANQLKHSLTNSPPDLVTWVPSHLFRKIQRRGAPGVELMARQVGQRLQIPSASLVRTVRYVRKQALLDDKSRLLNVRDAFALRKSYAWRGLPKLCDRHILLVDDVLTTGSTASEIAKVLKEAGASQVSLAVLARAVRS